MRADYTSPPAARAVGGRWEDDGRTVAGQCVFDIGCVFDLGACLALDGSLLLDYWVQA